MKTYVKMKEFGPVGGGGRPSETFVCRSATGSHGTNSHNYTKKMGVQDIPMNASDSGPTKPTLDPGFPKIEAGGMTYVPITEVDLLVGVNAHVFDDVILRYTFVRAQTLNINVSFVTEVRTFFPLLYHNCIRQ